MGISRANNIFSIDMAPNLNNGKQMGASPRARGKSYHQRGENIHTPRRMRKVKENPV